MKKIAITGGIGSGKSTVVRILKDAGYSVYSCDEIYRDVIKQNEYINQVQQVFPDAVENGVIRIEKLSKSVFNDKEKREQLNALAHPKIMGLLNEKMNQVKSELVFAEVPLLFEGGYENDFDERIVIMRPLDEKILSVCKRDKTDKESVWSRIRSQLNYEDEKVLAFLKSKNTIIIHNVGTEQDLKEKIFSLLSSLSWNSFCETYLYQLKYG